MGKYVHSHSLNSPPKLTAAYIQPAHLVKSTQDKGKKPALLVYDYAVGGATVSGVIDQINRHFIRGIGAKLSSTPWTPDDSLFGQSPSTRIKKNTHII